MICVHWCRHCGGHMRVPSPRRDEEDLACGACYQHDGKCQEPAVENGQCAFHKGRPSPHPWFRGEVDVDLIREMYRITQARAKEEERG